MLSSALFLQHVTRLAKEGVCASIGLFYLKKKSYILQIVPFFMHSKTERFAVSSLPLWISAFSYNNFPSVPNESHLKSAVHLSHHVFEGLTGSSNFSGVTVSIVFLSPWPLPFAEIQDKEGWSEDLQEAVSLQCPWEESTPSDWTISLLT